MALDEALEVHREAVVAALTEEDKTALGRLLPELRSADLGEILEDLLEDKENLSLALALLEGLSLERRANVLGYLPGDEQLLIAEAMSETSLLAVLEEMGSDERADLFNLFGEDRRELLLRRMARQEREDLKRLASYEEGTAGSIMTSDYVAVPTGMTVSHAMLQVRQTAPDAETVYQLFIIDSQGRLAGTLSLRQLMVARPGAQAATLMVPGMATGDVGIKDWGRMLGRELLVAGSLGLTMALAVAPIGVMRGGEDVAIIVAMSMVIIVLFGSLLGMCLPFVLDRLGWDPATAFAPLVTTLIDASGVLIYFGIATAILTSL